MQATLRDRLHAKFPQATFFFLSADIVGQILNFGLPSPIDVQIAGSPKNTAQDLQISQDLLEKIQKIPGAVDVRQQQIMGVPQIRVNVDRTRASQLGMTQRDVANGLLVSLAGSSQTAPSFFLDPTTGVSYSVTVQTPQYDINDMDSLLSTPVTPATETAGQMPQLWAMSRRSREARSRAM